MTTTTAIRVQSASAGATEPDNNGLRDNRCCFVCVPELLFFLN